MSQRRQNGNVALVEERRSWHKRVGNGFCVVVGKSRPAGGKLARRDWRSDGIGLVWSATLHVSLLDLLQVNEPCFVIWTVCRVYRCMQATWAEEQGSEVLETGIPSY